MSSSRRSRSRRLKRLLSNLAVTLLAVVAVLLLVGLFLPRNYHVERRIEIRARAETVYPDLARLRRWPEWTVWNQEMDPAVRFTFESPDTGVGAAYEWTGPKLGEGRLRLTKAEPSSGVWYELDFDRRKYLSNGSITFEGTNDVVRVTWLHEGSLGKNPVGRYVGLFMDKMLGADLEKGLARLKQRAEAAPKP